jgi:hypothetical protein
MLCVGTQCSFGSAETMSSVPYLFGQNDKTCLALGVYGHMFSTLRFDFS